MAFSTQRVISDGTLTLLDLSIQYFSRQEIRVYIADVLTSPGPTTWDWVGTTEKRIQFNPAVPSGINVLIQRTTDISVPRHSFVGGAAFTYQSVDENTLQVLRITQEARENSSAISDVFNPINMHGNKLTNLAPGLSPGETVEYSQFVLQNNIATAAAATATAAATTAVDAASTASAAAGTAVNSAALAATYANLSLIRDYGFIGDTPTTALDYGSLT